MKCSTSSADDCHVAEKGLTMLVHTIGEPIIPYLMPKFKQSCFKFLEHIYAIFAFIKVEKY